MELARFAAPIEKPDPSWFRDLVVPSLSLMIVAAQQVASLPCLCFVNSLNVLYHGRSIQWNLLASQRLKRSLNPKPYTPVPHAL